MIFMSCSTYENAPGLDADDDDLRDGEEGEEEEGEEDGE